MSLLRITFIAASSAVALACEPRPAVPIAVGDAAAGTTLDTIRMDGSAGVRPLVEALARGYALQRPDITILIGDGLGAKARVTAVAESRIDIAMASHGVDMEELRARGLTAVEIARVAVVFGLHEDAAPVTVTEQQLCDLYGGRIANWRELGGADVPVLLLARPEGEVDADVVAAGIGCFPPVAQMRGARVLQRPDEMAEALSTTSGAVGMTSLPFVQRSGGTFRVLAIDGVEPTPANVRDGTHALTRQSFLVVSEEPSPAVASFLAFVTGAAGAGIMEAQGAVPLR